MSETKDIMETEAPTLVFDAAPAEENSVAAVTTADVSEASLEEVNLTEEEKKTVEEFTKQIDLSNSQAVLQYGAGTQKKMAEFSETALKSVSTKDIGEVGDMLSGLITELKSFDIDENEKGLKALFKKSANKVTALKAKYAKVETNVNEVSASLEGHQQTLLKDVAMLDKMYDANLSYYKELTMYILAGKKKLEEVRNTDLVAAYEKAKTSNLPEDAQAAKDLEEKCNRFEKKIHDLELTKTIAMQTAPQIRLVQNNDTLMAEKIQSTIVNTIPLWKSQMVLALGIEHSNQAAKAQREVTDMTNELLKKNADKLKQATIDTAKESERGIVDIETLTHTNESLISTLDEVMKIQAEGREKRAAAETEMQRIESELKSKLLEINA